MNESPEACNLILIVVTAFLSYKGFHHARLREQLIFEPIRVLRDRQYYRLVSCAFLHADWMHFSVNMFSLYAFGSYIEAYLGVPTFLLIYFAGIVGGSLLSLYLHRHHQYQALGASGGVCGIIYASIFLLPGGSIYIIPIPFGIPSSVYAILFLLVSFLGMRTKRGNIGHDAHLGGALVGLLTATALHPRIVPESPYLYSTVVAITFVLFLYSYRFPLHLQTHSPFSRAHWESIWRDLTGGFKNAGGQSDDQRLEELLEKVSRRGIHSLSSAEKRQLQEISRRKSQSRND